MLNRAWNVICALAELSKVSTYMSNLNFDVRYITS